jgi:hypothetical protein
MLNSVARDDVQGDAIEVPAMDTKIRKARSIVVTDTLSDIIARRRKACFPAVI